METWLFYYIVFITPVLLVSIWGWLRSLNNTSEEEDMKRIDEELEKELGEFNNYS